MKIYITGIAGFLGSHLAKRLKSLGSEMGNFLKNFRKAVDDKEKDQNEADK